MVPGRMRLAGDCPNGCQLFGRILETLIPSRDIVIDFYAEYTAGLRVAHNLVSIVSGQGIRSDADNMSPVARQ
jgi:hypothetical protein